MSKRFQKWKQEIKMETGQKTTNKELKQEIHRAQMLDKAVKRDNYGNFYDWE